MVLDLMGTEAQNLEEKQLWEVKADMKISMSWENGMELCWVG